MLEANSIFKDTIQAQTKHVCKPDVDQSLIVCSGCPETFENKVYLGLSPGATGDFSIFL